MNSPARSGNDPDYRLPRFIERHGHGYVPGVTSAQRLALEPVADWLEDVPTRAWSTCSQTA